MQQEEAMNIRGSRGHREDGKGRGRGGDDVNTVLLGNSQKIKKLCNWDTDKCIEYF